MGVCIVTTIGNLYARPPVIYISAACRPSTITTLLSTLGVTDAITPPPSPRYSALDYEALYARPPVIYISAACRPMIRIII